MNVVAPTVPLCATGSSVCTTTRPLTAADQVALFPLAASHGVVEPYFPSPITMSWYDANSAVVMALHVAPVAIVVVEPAGRYDDSSEPTSP